MKLAIIVNQQFLVIPESALANISQPNPLFSYEGVPGKLLFPISIPYQENAPILGLTSESAIVDNPIRFDCQMLLLDTWLLNGELVITKSNRKNIEISVACPFYDLSFDLFNTNIRELEWENINLSDPVPQIYIDIEFSLIGGAGPDTITVNTGFGEYEHVTDGFEGTPAVIGALYDAINLDTDESGISATIIGSNVLRLRQDALGTLNYVFDTSLISVLSATYTFTYDYMTWLTDWHDDLAAYLETTMEAGSIYPDTPIQWPTYRNQDHYGDLNPDFTGWVNNYEQGKPWINYSSTESMTGNKYTLVPMLFLGKVLEQIFSQAQISLSGPGASEERFRRILIDNNYSIGKEWYDPESDTEYVSFSASINPANHLPDMTVGEFMNAYRTKFNFYFWYDPYARKVEIRWREDVITDQKRSNWNDKPFAGEPIDEPFDNEGVTFSSPLDSSDEYAGVYPSFADTSILQHDDYVIGKGQLQITSEFTHPSVQIIPGTERPELGATAKVPVKKQAGSGDEWEMRRNSFAPGILIYVGDPGVWDCNLAAIDQLDVDGNDLGLEISLVWAETYAIFYPNWTQFAINSSRRRVIFALSIIDLMTFEYDSFYGHNNKDWLVESWEISDIIGNVVFCEFVLVRRRNYLN